MEKDKKKETKNKDEGVEAFARELRKLVVARSPLIWCVTWEEARFQRILLNVLGKTFKEPTPVFVWTVSKGLVDLGDGEVVAGTREPLPALEVVSRVKGPAFFIFQDLHPFFTDPKVVRGLRDVYEMLKDDFRTVFVSAPRMSIPPDLQKSVVTVELPLPNGEEIREVFNSIKAKHPSVSLDEDTSVDGFVTGAAGLTEDEAKRAFRKLFWGRKNLGLEALGELYSEKRQLIRKSGILDFIPPKVRMDHVGGLGRLKKWLHLRRRFFTQEAQAFGISEPKGVLLTGVSGCGKSLAVQAISAYWELPLVRLDLNRIYGGTDTTPEKALEFAIDTAEAVSPCILWIDEIETAIVGGGGGGVSTRVFSSFLTWMQEKTKTVFVAATANQIDVLPAELLRKGRFDEIFFVDLPSETERLDIFKVHLEKRGHDPEALPILNMAKATTNFTGAEIENAVKSALYMAFDEKRGLDVDDLYTVVGNTVPLATTMAEKIKAIKRWADGRAIRASDEGDSDI